MMKRAFFIFSIALVVIACDRRPSANFEGGVAMLKSPPAIMRAEAVSEKVVERKLIKNGTIAFSTKSVSEMRKEIEKITKEFNAYVSSENQQKFDEKIEYEHVIRIPAERFDGFVKVIEVLAGEIELRDFSTQDVTEQYIDVEARLRTKKEFETRYLQLLKKANNVKDMLAVENQISEVRSEIESMQGKINYLNDQVGFSTLTVRYHQTFVPDLGFGSRLSRSFVAGWHGLLTFLVGVVSAWPFILILFATLLLISRWSKKVNLRLKTSKQPD
jgi:hypothetical protein